MKTKMIALIALILSSRPLPAALQSETIVTPVDTRDYVLTVSSPYAADEVVPAVGQTVYSWRASFVPWSPEFVYEQDNTIVRDKIGYRTTGTEESDGILTITNLAATLEWEWNSAFWITWSTSGEGTLQANFSASGAWYPEGAEYLFRAVPTYGWLFTAWSGLAAGGPNTTNLSFVATAPGNLHATFSDDPDGDGLLNLDEWSVGADPWLSDTDGDTFNDLFEFNNGLSPTRDSSAFLVHIQENPATYGLYPSNAVLDVEIGQALFAIENGTAALAFQLEQSDNLITWTNAGEVLQWRIPVETDKQFFRIRGNAP